MPSGLDALSLDQGVHLANTLAEHRSPVVEEVTEAIYHNQGDRLSSFGEEGRERCREDLSYHLDYLAGSLLAGTTQPFLDYLGWLRGVLVARGVPTDSLPLSLSLLKDDLRGRLPAEKFGPIGEVLEAGRQALQEESKIPTPFAPPTNAAQRHPAVEALVADLLDADRGSILELGRAASEEEGYAAMAVRLIQPAMYRIGELWQNREISVAQEHLATALAQQLLVRQFARTAPDPPNGRRALFACVASNQHSLGLRMVADTFELHGWEVEFLGADTPTADLIDHIGQTRPGLVGLSVSLAGQLPILQGAVDGIRQELGTDSPWLVGGGVGLNGLPGLSQRLGLDAWHTCPQDALEESR